MSAMNSKLTAYVGTYTNGESKGIYKLTLDKESGVIENVELAADLGNPTYLAISKNNKYLYSVIKVGDDGGVAAFSINPSTVNLDLINYQVSKVSPPCHVSLDSSGSYLFSANYHKGTVDVFPIREDGGINSASSSITHEGSGPNKERQDKPHVHFVSLTPDEKYLCAVDLGIDKLAVYNLENGIISESEERSVSLTPGCGPRHLDFHPNGRFVYVNTELSGEVVVLEFNETNNKFNVIQYISTLPKDFQGDNLGSAIHISPDGKYLYAANRGHDSIAIFSVNDSSGKLDFVAHTSTEGSHPRDFQLDPSGSFILAANMTSNNIVTFKIDKETGKLEKINDEISIPSAVCIKFLND